MKFIGGVLDGVEMIVSDTRRPFAAKDGEAENGNINLVHYSCMSLYGDDRIFQVMVLEGMNGEQVMSALIDNYGS